MKRPERDFVAMALAPLLVDPPILARLALRLSATDREKAARFRREEDRARFILGRSVLARLLADELDYRPEVLNLALTEQGQPYLAAFPDVCFSISHAGEWVLVALAVGAKVGVDIESLDRRVDLTSLAERIFDSDDMATFTALPDAAKLRAFFRAWTGKEAVLKAKGLGLSGGVREVKVPLDDAPGTVADPADQAVTWHLRSVAVADGYVASVAVDRADLPAAPRVLAQTDLG